MVRTGARAESLRELLQASGLRPATTAPPRPSGSSHSAELLDLYRRLGGLQREPRFKPGSWDLVFEGPLVVELDEELHFNRYRALTLQTSWSASLPWAADYADQCRRHEGECFAAGSWGKRWTNSSCAQMFGGGAAGAITGEGAPRWKQRALYDAIKDTAFTEGVDFVMGRMSVHDDVGGASLGAVLERRASVAPHAVRELLMTRIAT